MNKNFSKKQMVQGNTLIAGIDVSKNFHVATFRLPDGKELKSMKFLNNRDDFNLFLARIQGLSEIYNLKRTVVGLEATGVYGQPLIHFLSSYPNEIVGVNPAHTKRAKELSDNSPQKDDAKDSRVIADLISQGKFFVEHTPFGVYANLRVLAHSRAQLAKYQTMLKNNIKELLCTIFPEFADIFLKYNFTKTAIHLLENYPTPEDILKLGREKLIKIIKEQSRCKLGVEQAEKLLACATNSIAVKEGQYYSVFRLKQLLFNLKNISQQITETEKLLEENLELIPYAKYILSIKGIGAVTTAVILGETGNLANFSKSEELIKLAGLNLYEISSGKFRGQRHITKRGRPLLRAILYLASVRLVKQGYAFHEYYKRKTSEGKIKNKVLIAVCKKLFCLVRVLAISKSNYIENYNHANCTIKSVGDNHETVRDVLRRSPFSDKLPPLTQQLQ